MNWLKPGPLWITLLMPPAAPVAASEWHVAPPASYAPLPEAVTSFGAAVAGDWLYIYGGHKGKRHAYTSNEVSGSCRRLNLQDGFTWETLPSDVPAQSPGLVAHRGWIYRIGGMAARNPAGAPHDLHSHATVSRLHPGDSRWEALPSMPEARSSHDAAVLGDTLYLVGGWRLRGAGVAPVWHETALALDLSRTGATWRTLPQPFKRRGLCLAPHGGQLWCLGGMTDGDSPSLAVDVLDVTTGMWRRGPDLPPGRLKGFGASACSLEGRLYVSGMSGTVWRLNTRGRNREKRVKQCGIRWNSPEINWLRQKKRRSKHSPLAGAISRAAKRLKRVRGAGAANAGRYRGPGFGRSPAAAVRHTRCTRAGGGRPRRGGTGRPR